MATAASQLRRNSWRRDEFLISTDSSLIPVKEVIKVFASKEFYWAKPLPEDATREMLDNGLSFGLYDTDTDSPPPSPGNPIKKKPSGPKFIGFARCVTDFTTVLYITDVWVTPAYRSEGLGTWLMECVNEVAESMPHLRKSMLATGDWEKSVPFYERVMGMKVTEGTRGETRAIMEKRGRGNPRYEEEKGGKKEE
ncbi:GNAT family N-acetyltransferase [Fusarium fujikuroi]|nr:GNAT family N-acetyltransferase [Fusarium fujikuroi]SCV57179.1 related to GNAT family N-acetyltransferase [Fusarium fujikuroi]